jgi:hypothetical protein
MEGLLKDLVIMIYSTQLVFISTLFEIQAHMWPMRL